MERAPQPLKLEIASLVQEEWIKRLEKGFSLLFEVLGLLTLFKLSGLDCVAETADLQ